MGLRSPFPAVPTHVQPKDVEGTMDPLQQSEQNVGDVFPSPERPPQVPSSLDSAQAEIIDVMKKNGVRGNFTLTGGGGAPLKDVTPKRTREGIMTPPGQQRDFVAERREQEDEVDQIISELNAGASGADRGAIGKAEDAEIDDFIRSFGAAGGTTDPEFDPNAPITEDAMTVPGTGVTVPTSLRGATDLAKNLFARFRAGLGRNGVERLRAFQAAYGPENVKAKDDEIWFKKPGEEKFRRVDPDQFETFADIFADLSGEIIEGTAAAFTEATAAAGTGGMGALAALPLAGAAGVATREAVIGAVDLLTGERQRDEEVNIANEIMWGAGLNVAFAGFGVAAKNVFKWGGESFAKIGANRQMRRIERLRDARHAIDEFTRRLGAGSGRENAVESAFGVVDKFGDNLAHDVHMVKQKAVELAGDQRFSMDNALGKMREILDDQFVPVDKDGFYRLPTGKGKTKLPSDVDLPEEFFDESGMFDLGPEVADDVAQLAKASGYRNIAPFGSDRGMSALRLIVNDYNTLKMAADGGGVPMQAVFDVTRKYQKLSKFQQFFGKGADELKAFREIQNSGISDRHLALREVLEGSGTAEEKIYGTAFENYANNIDEIVAIRKHFHSRESAAQFMDAIFQKENVTRVRSMKALLGPRSQEWGGLKGEWLNSLVQESIDPKTGIWMAGRMLDKIKSYGPEMVNEILSSAEQKALNDLSQSALEIQFSDLVKSATFDNAAENLAVASMTNYYRERIKVFWSIFSKNKYASDYLLDEGFMKVAAKQPNKTMRDKVIETMNGFREMVDRSRVIKVKRTNPKTGKQHVVEAYVPVARPAAVQSVKGGMTDASRRGIDYVPPAPAEGEEVDIDQLLQE